MTTQQSRKIWLAIALISFTLVTASVVLTFWLDLQPCHLCIFQRLLFMLMIPLGAIAWLAPGRVARLFFGLLTALTTACGAGVAIYQSWLQMQPSDAYSCSFGDPTPIEQLVDWLGQFSPTLFMAPGICEDEALVILGLSLANWALVGFLAFFTMALYALWRELRASNGA